MNSYSKTITNNSILDKVLIIFPVWFPLIYILILNNYPSISQLIFISSIFLFAETHFASTWLFFFDKDNHNWIKNNSYNYFYLPVYIIGLIIIVWFLNSSLIILFHYLASGWHVTKQSIGILKLYKVYNKLNSFLIYSISFGCLTFGLRNPGIIAKNFSSSEVNIFLLFFGVIYLLTLAINLFGKNQQIINNLLPVITGLLIYLPILFFENLALATVIGVGMHWIQYIAIMWSITLRKEKFNLIKIKNKFIFKKISRKILFIFMYSLIMTIFAVKGINGLSGQKAEYSIFYLIPIIFQFYHFYIDGFIWKFSEKHIRESVASYIYSSK